MKIYIHCKKNFRRFSKILFHKNEKYYYYSDDKSFSYIFIYYDEQNIRQDRQGYLLYFERTSYEEDNSLVHDFFYTQSEVRKLKLNKINESK